MIRVIRYKFHYTTQLVVIFHNPFFLSTVFLLLFSAHCSGFTCARFGVALTPATAVRENDIESPRKYGRSKCFPPRPNPQSSAPLSKSGRRRDRGFAPRSRQCGHRRFHGISPAALPRANLSGRAMARKSVQDNSGFRAANSSTRPAFSRPETATNLFFLAIQFRDKSSGICERSLFFQPPLLFRIFGQSWSVGVSKTSSTEAGNVSHALRFNSSSSCPGLQPA
jgi:hypothetical protein